MRHAGGCHRNGSASGCRRRRRGGLVRRARRAADRRPGAGARARPRVGLARARARAVATPHRLRRHAVALTGNSPVTFHGARRFNETHAPTTDPDSRLAKKTRGTEAKLAYLGEVLMDNRYPGRRV